MSKKHYAKLTVDWAKAVALCFSNVDNCEDCKNENCQIFYSKQDWFKRDVRNNSMGPWVYHWILS